ncbi:hypothetical protein POJ06DRAFT_284580 [Lipomyces tetrasporus]|uniref:Uncharacterized protein n=1 Tax=Lipomyces tetrasporus TaxID=54092 RepID=A0AAD7VWL9_9ASCO|nr:uncharacterized protein POJ06DRAFT_284580 [Lipomyces tetrasporus]KAJ8103660.1 hypothetical protein POJ06DRAFT_284580 [Lipomyces tetrasporus]
MSELQAPVQDPGATSGATGEDTQPGSQESPKVSKFGMLPQSGVFFRALNPKRKPKNRPYRIVTNKEYSEEEALMKALYPPSTRLESTLVKWLLTSDQISRFAREHPDPGVAAVTFDRLGLPSFVNEWKVRVLQEVSMREGRIKLHTNDISASVQALRGRGSAKVYKEALRAYEETKQNKLAALGGPRVSRRLMMSSFKDQPNSIKDEAANEYKLKGVDAMLIPYDTWAADCWATVRYEIRDIHRGEAEVHRRETLSPLSNLTL